MALRGVIFDMGGTLLHYTPPGKSWEYLEKVGAASVYRRLAEWEQPPVSEAEALETAWQHALSVWTALHTFDVKDLKLNLYLKRLIAQWGIARDLLPGALEALAEAYMTAIQAHVFPLDGAADVLRALRERGLRVGLISNTMWPGEQHRYDLDRYHLTPLLEHLIFSADVEAWKPFRQIFELGLAALDLRPDETAYVGDSLYFDVWGAQQAGMRGVWIEQPHRWLPDGVEVTPDATIKTLPDLLPLIEAWR